MLWFVPRLFGLALWRVLFVSRNRNKLVVKGLGQVGDSGQQRDQDLLRPRLSALIQAVGCGVDVRVVNVIVYPSSNPVYDVELDSAASVEAVVRGFFKFTRRRDPVRKPRELEKVSMHHSVTPGTRVRISLLRVRKSFFFSLILVIHPCVFQYVLIQLVLPIEFPFAPRKWYFLGDFRELTYTALIRVYQWCLLSTVF